MENKMTNMKQKFIFMTANRRILQYICTTLNEELYQYLIHKELDITYSHVVRSLKEMKKRGYVTLNKKGRTVYVKPTKQAKAVAKIFSKLEELP